VFLFSGCGLPTLFIPHRVLCELDSLKDARDRTKNVSDSAQKAVKFLNALLSEKHLRVEGEKLESYLETNTASLSADDKILRSCIRVKTTNPEKRLVSMLESLYVA